MGTLRNGRFPDQLPRAKASVNTFNNISVKAGGLYKLSGRQFVSTRTRPS
jgi:hypothetical protein